MKKVFTIALAASLLAGAAQAQEAFKHLGMSLEAGTTGLGVNLSYPLVTDHLVLTLGYNLPTFNIKTDFDLNGQPINDRVNSANAMIDTYNNLIGQYPDQAAERGMKPLSKINNIENINTKIEAKLNFVNFKAFLEYYPTTKSYFHLTAGVMIGSGEWMTIDAKADEAAWRTYTTAIEENKTIPHLSVGEISDGSQYTGAPVIPSTEIHPVEGLENAAVFNINGQTFHLSPNSGGRLSTKLTVKKVKPYLGVGFGSSVPTKHRLGCQFELGAYYQGKPTLESDSEVPFNSAAYSSKTVDDIMKTIVHFQWYPQMTLRFTGRLF